MLGQEARFGLVNPQHRNNDQQLNAITVEEGMDCRQANSRFFNLINQDAKLSVTISQSSSIIGCKMDGQDVILGERILEDHEQETWALCDRALIKATNLSWNCHVRGSELILTIPNATSVTYELNTCNELNSSVKLKSANIQNRVTYFNLKNCQELTLIDGHTLSVKCNGSLNRIQVQDTKLLHPNQSSMLPKSLIGDVPFELVHHDAGYSTIEEKKKPSTKKVDSIVCDAIFSLESQSNLDNLTVQLQYASRAIKVDVRCSNHRLDPAQPSSSKSKNFPKTECSNRDPANRKVELSQSDEPPASSSSTTTNRSCTNASPPQSGPSTLRVRVRVTNFGVCILPLMMKNYFCRYQFIW